MNRLEIKKIEKDNGYISINVYDSKQDISFWLDCSLMDGYGNRTDFQTEDLYIDWDFNQYIFHLDYEEDVKAKEYQENGDNIDSIQDLIDDKNDELVAILRG